MRRISNLVIGIILCAFAVACGRGSSSSEDEYIFPTEQAEANLKVIIESIDNQDSEAIKSLLSDYFISNCKDVDSKLDEMIHFVEGDIISYDEPFGSACGSIEEKDAGAKIECFTTSEGTEYYIAIKQWHRYDEQPEQVGIYNITIKNLSLLHNDSESEDAVFRLNVFE